MPGIPPAPDGKPPPRTGFAIEQVPEAHGNLFTPPLRKRNCSKIKNEQFRFAGQPAAVGSGRGREGGFGRVSSMVCASTEQWV
jgi:hypothetical protein